MQKQALEPTGKDQEALRDILLKQMHNHLEESTVKGMETANQDCISEVVFPIQGPLVSFGTTARTRGRPFWPALAKCCHCDKEQCDGWVACAEDCI